MAEWNGTINPTDETYDDKGGGGGDRTRWCGQGRKVLAAIGFERWTSSQGSAMLSIRFVCVDDLEEGGEDVGAHVWRNFALTQKAVSFFARFARAIGWLAPFNVFKDEDITEILGKGSVIGRVEIESFQRNDGKTGEKGEVKFFDPFEGRWEPGWDTTIAKAESEWDSYLEWREKNPRGAKKAPRGRAGGSGGSSGGGSSMRAHDDDIPF